MLCQHVDFTDTGHVHRCEPDRHGVTAKTVHVNMDIQTALRDLGSQL